MNQSQPIESANILVVDDTPDNLRLLTGVLKQQGYQVRPVLDGDLAIAAAISNPPDLILLDILMPDLNGYEVCKQLKADPRTGEIPIIFISAKGEVFDKVKAFSLGAVDYITKPFEVPEVLARVENQLKIWRLQKQLTEQNKRLSAEVGDRISMEAALKHSEQQYRALVESSQDMIWSVNPEGYLTFVNPAVRKIYGYEPSDILGCHFSNFVSSEQLLAEQALFKRLLQGISVFQYETTHIDKNGEPIYLSFNAIPLRDKAGKIIGITGTTSNITKRRKAEEALRESENRYRSLVESQDSVLVCRWKTDTTLTFVNQCYSRFFGKSPTDLIGVKFLDLLPQEFRSEIQKNIDVLSANPRPQTWEHFMNSDSGQKRWFTWTDLPIFNHQGDLIEFQSFGIDITYKKEQDEALNLIVQGTVAQTGCEFFRSCVRYLAEVLHVRYALIAQVSDRPQNQAQTLAFWQDQTEASNINFKLSGTPYAEILRGNSCFYSENVQSLFPQDLLLAKLKAQSVWAMPLKNYQDELLGFLAVLDTEPIALDPAKKMILQIFAARAGAEIERQQAERELRESQRFVERITEASPNLLYIYDIVEESCIYKNRETAMLLGYACEEIQTMGTALPETILHPEDLAQIPLHIERVYSLVDGEVFEYESRLKDVNNQWRTFFVRETPFARDLDGSVKQILGSATDITERKRAEEALRESAERERAIAKVIQQMRQSLDLKTIFIATTSELRQVINCDRVAVYQFNADWSGKIVAESVGNQWISLLEAQSNDPQLTENLMGDAHCQVKNLAKSQDLMADTYLQTTAGGAYRSGVTSRVTNDIYTANFSPCYLQLLEHFQVRAYIIVPIFCQTKLWGLLAIYQNTGPRNWQPAEINIVVQIGNQLGVALQQAELLERTQQQSEALKAAAIAADAANRAKTEFLANMSHELRTPLNAILGFAQVMSRDPSLSQQHQQNIGIINRAGEHLLELINDILEMSKIEAGRTKLNETMFDLISLLKNLEEILSLKAKSKGLNLIFDLAPNLPVAVITDEGKLRQVLLNILGNAIKFTTTGCVILRAFFVAKEEAKKLEKFPQGQEAKSPELTDSDSSLLGQIFFEIEDTGPGIPPEDIHLLFEPFIQTEIGRSSHQGTGLGLPISQKFVQLMGGEIRVRSQLSQGSIFSFNIQIKPAEVAQLPSAHPSSQVLRLAPNQPEYRILVVDDLAESRLLLVQLLESIGFSVCEAKNGQDAIALWESWEPHLIIMDMRMPVMDGYEATKKIKSTLKGQATAILALTASAFEEERKIVLSAGCDDFIRKPFQTDILLQKIQEHLGFEYLYQSPEDRIAMAQKHSENLVIFDFKKYLAKMPPSWVAQIYQAAAEGSDDGVLELLTHLSPEDSQLGQAFSDLAKNFQFEIIMKLTQPFLPS